MKDILQVPNYKDLIFGNHTQSINIVINYPLLSHVIYNSKKKYQ